MYPYAFGVLNRKRFPLLCKSIMPAKMCRSDYHLSNLAVFFAPHAAGKPPIYIFYKNSRKSCKAHLFSPKKKRKKDAPEGASFSKNCTYTLSAKYLMVLTIWLV